MGRNNFPEWIYKIIFKWGDGLDRLRHPARKFFRSVFFISSLTMSGLFVYYIGFPRDPGIEIKFPQTFYLLMLLLWVSKYIPGVLFPEKKFTISLLLRILLFMASTVVLIVNLRFAAPATPMNEMFQGSSLEITLSFLMIISETPLIFNIISKSDISPALIFSVSFALIIFLGTGLLLMPNAHTGSLSILDALFTSVSAVCVTGLIVVDTAASFSMLGKIIILCLIQAGGLGIMTFTGFFSYMFASRSSIQERLLLRNIFSAESMGNLFKILSKIILITILTELTGALIIYTTLGHSVSNSIFFSLFHSVSAFCNAGFSTLSAGLSSIEFNGNYVLKTTLAILIILGGIGFPVLLKIYSFTKHIFKSGLRKIRMKTLPVIRGEFGLGGRIVIATTIILVSAGTLILFILERNNSLAGMNPGARLFASFFDSVTARTAGFSVHNFQLLGNPAVFIIILLMWIGASPGSTGGGIKTTTFAIAVRNAWAKIRGDKTLEMSKREINQQTITRVFSIIFLSFLVISVGTFILLVTEKGKTPISLLFESVSAFSTVGLSIADTPSFTNAGKIVLILLMFTGRIGPLTLFSGIFAMRKRKFYNYPVSDIIIN